MKRKGGGGGGGVGVEGVEGVTEKCRSHNDRGLFFIFFDFTDFVRFFLVCLFFWVRVAGYLESKIRLLAKSKAKKRPCVEKLS